MRSSPVIGFHSKAMKAVGGCLLNGDYLSIQPSRALESVIVGEHALPLEVPEERAVGKAICGGTIIREKTPKGF